MKQRSSFAITTLILETVARSEPYGISKTKIMQNVMLNYKRVNRYCAEIIARDLVCYDTKDHYFHITDKGRFVLSNCNELAQFISPINRLMNKYRPLDSSSSSSFSSSSISEDSSSYVWQHSQAKAWSGLHCPKFIHGNCKLAGNLWYSIIWMAIVGKGIGSRSQQERQEQ